MVCFNDDDDGEKNEGGGATGCSSDLCVRGSRLEIRGEGAVVVVVAVLAAVSLAFLLLAASSYTFL